MGGFGRIDVVREDDRPKDYRLVLSGVVRKKEGVWTEEDCQRFWEAASTLMDEHGVTYFPDIIVVAPKSHT